MKHRNADILTAVTTLLLALTAALAGCGGGGGDATPTPMPTPPLTTAPPASVERNLDPSTIDAGVVASSKEFHVAINPSPRVAAANKLFVFLPGTDGVPDQYRLILRAGANRGFHAIGLDYPNAAAVGVLCAGSADADCFWNVRREVITGQDLSTVVAIDNANSIVTRLTKAIAYLHQNHADEGWGRYLVNGSPDWSKVIVGGHSQGGGHAGVMTKLYTVSRACYFASPPDWNTRSNQPADWESKANLTSAAAQFGFASLDDPNVPYAQLSVIWQTLGLAAFGPAISVDTSTAPFAGSHVLTTRAQPAASNTAGTPLHGLTVRDAFTPLGASGQPLFDAAWGYLCFQ